MLGTIFAGAMLSIFSPNIDLLPPKPNVDNNVQEVSNGYIGYLLGRRAQLRRAVASGDRSAARELRVVERKIKSYYARKAANDLQKEIDRQEQSKEEAEEAAREQKEKRQGTLDDFQKMIDITRQTCSSGSCGQ